MIQSIRLTDLQPHPKNPRLAPRQDVIDQIATQIAAAGAFDPAHALIVRPAGEKFEVISGHHRAIAAHKTGLKEVPCWVRDLSDDDAYMALALNNAQGELHPLEEGMHALGFIDAGGTACDYAAKTGKAERTTNDRIWAARVASGVDIHAAKLRDFWSSLAAIHPCASWIWPALVARMVKDGWTVKDTKNQSHRLQHVVEPPEWADKNGVAKNLVSGLLNPSEIAKFASIVAKTEASVTENGETSESLLLLMGEKLKLAKPATWTEVNAICNSILDQQAELLKQRRQADLLRITRDEEVKARTARMRQSVSLEEWKTLAADEQAALLNLQREDGAPGSFNKQENDAIEWAQWSWNPVTGCQHTCSYCYARDIAESARMAKSYPNGFAPTFRPLSVLAPRSAAVPDEAATDARYRNVFTCSMADLFGRWVPAEWISAVLNEMRAAPQWNFLCLTKFPKRMAEFDIPDNAWMGTTVDLQARVPSAEAAFAKVNAGVKWLSIEPMLEPLKFKHLERFDWVVIGGSSRSSQTPEWVPPFEWIEDLLTQARAAGCKVYFKTNLGMKKRLLELPFDAAIPRDDQPAPAQFNYLGKKDLP